MTAHRPSRSPAGPALALAVAAVALATAMLALAPPAQGSEAAEWRLEQPRPPQPPFGVPESSTPIPLGRIGDVQFWAPNRGLLITAGNPPTVEPGVWAYDGVDWHELTAKGVCGATDGRIAWAGPEEFWTVSDGRAGQATESGENLRLPPLEDNTLCHFVGGQVAGSYAHPAFQADSYQAMHAAACFDPSDCWFAGDSLEEPQIGSFQLHWNGSSLEEQPFTEEGRAVESTSVLEGILYEGVRIAAGDRVATPSPEPPAVRRVNPEGFLPPFEPETEVPLYGGEERPEALDFLHLAAAGGTLWGAAGPKGSEAGAPGQVTVVRRREGLWSQLIGPEHPLGPLFSDASEEEALLGRKTSPEAVVAREAAVSAIAVEPDGQGAWIALQPPAGRGALVTERAVVVRVSATGQVSAAQALPSSIEMQGGVGPKGAASKLACPAANDCWLTTAQGWLYHLAPPRERTLARDEDPVFAGPITYRPPDQGLPQLPADAPPPDTSGLVEPPPDYGTLFTEAKSPPIETTVTAPLLTHLHSRVIGGRTLELSFHLAVKARVRLLAKRRRKLVASTPMRTLSAGTRRLLLRLNPRAWPTKLSLQTHPLAPLPLLPAGSAGGPEHASSGTNSVSTGLVVLPRIPTFAESEHWP